MRLFFAAFSANTKVFSDLKDQHVDLLESYLFFRKKNTPEYLEAKGLSGIKLFLDSGAFSAFTQGVKIDIDQYISFIKKNKEYIDIYAALDVIGDFQKTKENLRYMESKGLTPLPTFHFGSPMEELDRLCREYDFIALGGLVPLALQKRKITAWLDSCFSVIKNYWPKKIHGFGVNNYELWKRYPFYSVDATSWAKYVIYGYRIEYKKGKFKSHRKDNYSRAKAKIQTSDQRSRDTLIEFLAAQNVVTRLWEERGVKF